MLLRFQVTTRYGTAHIVQARDADHARAIVRAELRARYPRHVPAATAERYADRDIDGATVARAPGGITA